MLEKVKRKAFTNFLKKRALIINGLEAGITNFCDLCHRVQIGEGGKKASFFAVVLS